MKIRIKDEDIKYLLKINDKEINKYIKLLKSNEIEERKASKILSYTSL